ncbi:MAG: carboxypeptidase-like regulatory domain-containing protein [Rikenellaceae bacterium]|nr:carboxypeptidase-like regulatory domain-containing protein [Rikenellaceae bacterium]
MLSGKVSDKDGLAIPGVGVMVKGSSSGTTTDGEGRYTLPVTPGATV